ncbi:MAG TPA: hypothetical protein VGT61_12805 [Thermomicrobiales bacterium]|jgi:uncharacterized membrane protein YhaH (DUF805 family)|nr:hypothetical protein [Thermomicrobiales bacterium]
MDWLTNIYDALDPRLWGLLAVALGTILTLQAVETAVEGAWPHQRRPGQTAITARSGQRGWAVVALLLLVALLLVLVTLAIVAWRDLDLDRTQWLGGILVALAWILFLAATTTRLAVGRYLRGLGMIAPATIAVVLVVGGILILVRLLDILPTVDEVRDALPF